MPIRCWCIEFFVLWYISNDTTKHKQTQNLSLYICMYIIWCSATMHVSEPCNQINEQKWYDREKYFVTQYSFQKKNLASFSYSKESWGHCGLQLYLYDCHFFLTAFNCLASGRETTSGVTTLGQADTLINEQTCCNLLPCLASLNVQGFWHFSLSAVSLLNNITEIILYCC